MSATTATTPAEARARRAIVTDIPARLDRLPWSGWHWLLVSALGVTWTLGGLEVTIVGSVGSVLGRPDGLGLSDAEVGLSGTLYLAGAIVGSLVFGRMTDTLGRKKLFVVTLGIYLAAAVATALAWDFWSFAVFRCITGAAIGGEYAAITSAIDEFIPARVRGQADLAINGTYWAGAGLGALASIILLDRALVPGWLGWRLCFGLGALLGAAMILVRRYVPESPRWLLTHGRFDEAERITAGIEGRVAASAGKLPEPDPNERFRIRPGGRVRLRTVLRTIFLRYRQRALLGFVLIATQAFFYNAVFFTFPLVLTRFFGVEADDTGRYLVPFALGNFLGPVLLGRLFDTVGRRRMITGCYLVSGVMISVGAWLLLQGRLDAASQTALWAVTFFFASSAASAAYLTVSEIFPVETRAMAIAVFYAIGTAVGGLLAPWLFGVLIETRRPEALVAGYFLGGALMGVGAAAEWFLGVDTERRPLEEVAPPLTSEPDPDEPDPATPSPRVPAVPA
jgi:MFS family permease